MYNFDEIIDRRGTGSVRWDNARKKYGEPDLLPLTTADMDFRVAGPIQEAIIKAAEFGVFGYTQPRDSYYEAVEEQLARKWHWNVRREWISYSAGIVGAIAFCVQGMTTAGDQVALLTPIYHPFSHIIENNGRKVICSVLKQPLDGRAEIDFENLETVLSDEKTRMLIFCNPHNPIGRAWESRELDQVAELCVRHHVILVSDEIHSDFVFSGHTFTSAAVSMERLGGLEQLVICTSASKSYNIAGLQTSNIIIPGNKLREQYTDMLMRQHYMEMNQIGPIATEAAYRYCDDWLSQAVDYLEQSRDYIMDYTERELSGIRAVKPEATYMIWLDCRQLGMSEDKLEEFLIHKAKVGLNMGSTFGPGGEGYVRMNFAAPRSVIGEALQRIKEAL